MSMEQHRGERVQLKALSMWVKNKGTLVAVRSSRIKLPPPPIMRGRIKAASFQVQANCWTNTVWWGKLISCSLILKLRYVLPLAGIFTESCFSPVDRGTCLGEEKRFAFNPRTKRCHVFSYGGCGGNKNNFKRRKDCIFKCIGSRKGTIVEMLPHWIVERCNSNVLLCSVTAHGKMIRIRKKNIGSIVHRSAWNHQIHGAACIYVHIVSLTHICCPVVPLYLYKRIT